MNVPLLTLMSAQTPLVFAGWLVVTIVGALIFLYGSVRHLNKRNVDLLAADRDF